MHPLMFWYDDVSSITKFKPCSCDNVILYGVDLEYPMSKPQTDGEA